MQVLFLISVSPDFLESTWSLLLEDSWSLLPGQRGLRLS